MITVEIVLSRTNVYDRSVQMKTIGRRVAQSFRAQHPGEEPAKIEGKKGRMVNGYPDEMKGDIEKIARKYCRQHGYKLDKIKRKRKKDFYNSKQSR